MTQVRYTYSEEFWGYAYVRDEWRYYRYTLKEDGLEPHADSELDAKECRVHHIKTYGGSS